MSGIFLALDIGGTKLACGLATAEGRLLARAVAPTDRKASTRAIFEQLLQLSEAAFNDSSTDPSEIAAVGISYGGPVDYAAGRTVTCHHLPGWEDVPLKEWAQQHFNLPADMDNDANVAALGEAVYGAGKGHEFLLYLTVSSGIGGGIILGGQIYRGAASMAGEIGHTVIEPEGPACACGKRGCLEALASGWSIARRAREALGQAPHSALCSLPPDQVTAAAVARAAESGDALSLAVINQTADYLGRGIAAGINLLNPSVVVIGGGVSKAGEVLFAPLRSAVEKYAVAESFQAVRILPAALGDDGALLGAIALAARAVA